MNFLFKKAMLFMVFLCLFTIVEARNNKVSPLPPTCANGVLTLVIQFDNHPEEVLWTIRDATNNILMAWQSNGQIAGTQEIITIPALANGDYLLAFHDTGGNGICCQNGNGYYELSDPQGVIVSGDIYAYSDVTQFCVGASAGNVLDTTQPTTPGLSSSNITTSSVDLTITPSTDNVGVVGYVVFQDGLIVQDVIGANPGTVTVGNLTQNTSYDFKVVALDAAGNASPESNTVMLRTSSRCANGALTLVFQFDDYPGETAWDIKDAANNIVASSGSFTYFNEAPNSTLTENIATLTDGDYILVVYDTDGNGMCCQEGSGSYIFSDTQGVMISGSTFGFSDVTEFCVGTYNGGGLDTIPPTNPTITASNPTATTIDIVITPSTDNVGVTYYRLFQNGVILGDINPPNPLSGTIMNLPTDSTFSYYVVARDAAGNFSGISNIVVETTLPLPTSTLLHDGYFETGLDGWTDGGGDCKRVYKPARSFEGNRSMRLRDNSGVSSSMTLSNLNLTSYTNVNLEFQYYIHSFEGNEDFWVRYHDGSTWTTIATYQKGVDFTGNGFYSASIDLASSNYNFPANAKFRIQCDASGNGDHVYIDAVIITANSNNFAAPTPSQALAMENEGFFAMPRLAKGTEKYVFTPRLPEPMVLSEVHGIEIFPNPVSNTYTIKGISANVIKSVSILNLNGQVVKTYLSPVSEYDVSTLSAGIYVVEVQIENELSVIKKIVVK